MQQYHPEIVAIAMLVVSWLVRLSQAHGIAIDQETHDNLLLATAYLITWAYRKWFAEPQPCKPQAENDNTKGVPL